MGTITGQDILTRQRDLIQDVDAVRWDNIESLRWLNDGLIEIVRLRPEAYTTRVAGSLALGTRQSLTSMTLPKAHAVLDVPANILSGGAIGDGITKADLRMLDRFEPTWRTKTATKVEHWSPIPNEPKSFYVYPGPATVPHQVEMVVATAPPVLSSLSNAIPFDDIYANALGYYLAFRLYSKDADEATNAAAAQGYYTLFTNSLGG
jgi:hypothetical protein